MITYRLSSFNNFFHDHEYISNLASEKQKVNEKSQNWQCAFPKMTYDIIFSTKKWCLSANQSGIDFSRFPSLRRLQATPLLQLP